jgi:beta-aspartyl-peptidase (threonine type)
MTCLMISVVLVATMTGCQTTNVPSKEAHAEVRAVLEQQERAWNAGDLAGFMQGYAKGDRTRFASGGEVTLGWQTVFDRYQKKYGTGANLGILRFSELDIRSLSPDCALAFGRWDLTRGAETSSGLFTLLFRKTPDGWRIFHDHTSSAAKQ